MAEAFLYGVDGAIVFGGDTFYNVNNWRARVTPGIAMTGGIGDSGPHRDYTKWNDWTGSLEAELKRGDSVTTAASQEVVALFVKGSTAAAGMLKAVQSSKSMYYGTVVFTGVDLGQDADGLGTFSADWAQADGPLSWSSNTST